MSFDQATLYAFLLVFIRCSAMLISSPMFGAQNTPLQVRIFTTLALSGALTCVVKPAIGPMPDHLGQLFVAVGQEIAAGLLIGTFMMMVLHMAQIAGTLMDTQVGLGMSQVMNPATGVHVTILSQFKFMLGLVLYLSMDCHHLMIQAFVHSYSSVPSFGVETMPELLSGVVRLLGSVSLIALQIAAPVLAVTMVVDAALGLVNKAVPQMQAMVVGLPAKIVIGLIAVSLGLPALATGVSSGVGIALDGIGHALRMK